MNSKKIFFSLLLWATLICSCNDVITDSEQELTSLNVSSVELSYIDTCSNVSTEMAEKVAEIFNSQTLTRTNLTKKIDNICVVKRGKRDTLMYIINYAQNEGFIIVSANQNYTPVLAYSDSGNFNLNTLKGTATEKWFETQKHNIDSISCIPDSVLMKYRNMWFPYKIRNKKRINSVSTKSDSNSEIVDKFVNNNITQWKSEGYEVFSLSEYMQSGEFDKLYPTQRDEIIRKVQEQGNPYWGGFYKTSFFLIGTESHYEFKGDFIKSKWGQQRGYNLYTPNNFPAGCVAVAVAQIMRYHEYPTFSWKDMEYEYATDATAHFLSNVGVAVKTDYGKDESSSDIDKALYAFKYAFGYSNAKKVDHDLATVRLQLNQSLPVYMRGYDSSGFLGFKRSGHAWICDGYSGGYYVYNYKVVTLEYCPWSYIPQKFITVWNGGASSSPSYHYHMNWGWYGDHNGYYMDDNVNIPQENYNFAHGREDIINICKP